MISAPRAGWKAAASVRAGENVLDSMPSPAMAMQGRLVDVAASDTGLPSGGGSSTADGFQRGGQRLLQTLQSGTDQPGVRAEDCAFDGQVLGHQRMAALVELTAHRGDERFEGREQT